MKKLMLTVLLVAVCALAASAADITGKWVAQVPGRDGPMEQTYVFKVDAGKITGSVTINFGGEPMEQTIVDGKLEGDAISFTVDIGEFKILHKGSVSGDSMKLKVEMGDQSFDMAATRVRDAK